MCSPSSVQPRRFLREALKSAMLGVPGTAWRFTGCRSPLNRTYSCAHGVCRRARGQDADPTRDPRAPTTCAAGGERCLGGHAASRAQRSRHAQRALPAAAASGLRQMPRAVVRQRGLHSGAPLSTPQGYPALAWLSCCFVLLACWSCLLGWLLYGLGVSRSDDGTRCGCSILRALPPTCVLSANASSHCGCAEPQPLPLPKWCLRPMMVCARSLRPLEQSRRKRRVIDHPESMYSPSPR